MITLEDIPRYVGCPLGYFPKIFCAPFCSIDHKSRKEQKVKIKSVGSLVEEL